MSDDKNIPPDDVPVVELTLHPPGCSHRKARQEESSKGSTGGPAQVATKQYRNNYDTIFGKKVSVGQA